MQIKEYASLLPYTSFYIGGPSRYLIFAETNEEVSEAVKFARGKDLPLLIFGGGSNLLVADNGFPGVAVRIETVGMDIVEETAEYLYLQVAAGEVWDDVVRLAVEENWWGIENLSHIPGFTGALAVQNVGAYGQEASDVVVSVQVLDRQDLQIKTLLKSEMGFGYRRSIFNTTERERYVILSTTLQLRKHSQPNLSYGDLAERFAGQTPTITDIREAVIAIRNRKFPFPSQPTQGNAGSFFRSRILSPREFTDLEQMIASKFGASASARIQAMQTKLQVAQGYKTPVAFLIELCVGKDLAVGGAAINSKQPAIILNQTGMATASEVLTLFRQVQSAVKVACDVDLEAEPELIGFSEQEIAGCKFSPTIMV